MRRLAGMFIFVVGSVLVIYSASWMLLSYKTQAKTHINTRKYVLSEKIVASITPILIPTKIPISTSTPIPTSSPTPTPSAKQNSTEEEVSSNQQSSEETQDLQNTSVSNAQEQSHKDFILDKINEYRTSQGISLAVSNNETCSFARIRAEEISSNFNHDSFTQKIGSNTLPYSGYSLVTENIAMTPNYQDVVSIWIKSTPHAENMRKDTPFICVEQSGNYYAYEGWKP